MKSSLQSENAGQPAPEFFLTDVTEALSRFYLDLHPSKNRKLVVVCGGLERCNLDFTFVRRETFPIFLD